MRHPREEFLLSLTSKLSSINVEIELRIAQEGGAIKIRKYHDVLIGFIANSDVIQIKLK